MRTNLAFWDRLLRFFLGIFLTAWAVAGGPWWGYIGVYLILTSAWGLCPVYAILKIRTAPAESRNLVPPE
jgi:hypothetical protein